MPDVLQTHVSEHRTAVKNERTRRLANWELFKEIIEMTSVGNGTKNNHFVPRFYLKNFMGQGGFLYMKDKTTGEVYKKNEAALKKVASKKNLYSVQDKISDEDLNLIIKMNKINDLPENSLEARIVKDYLFTIAKFLNDDMGDLFTLSFEADKALEKELNALAKRELNNSDISRNQELLFTLYESDFKKIYDEVLKNENLSSLNHVRYPENTEESYLNNIVLYIKAKVSLFIYQVLGRKLASLSGEKAIDSIQSIPKNSYYDFLHYILIQYLRTNKIMNLDVFKEERMKKIASENGINAKNFMFLMIQYQTLKLLDSLVNDHFQFVLIKNHTDVSFITSDQPCINTYHYIQEEFNRYLEVDEFEIYFPLSPTLAVLFSKRGCYGERLDIHDCKDIWGYNYVISQTADRYLYGNSERVFERI